jgi:quercetin dioxygenase-like cupin family protein
MQSFRSFLATVSLFTVALAVTPSVSQAQQNLDATTADPQHHKVIFENDQVRVVRYLIPAGETAARHSHPNCVAVFLTDATARVTTDDGAVKGVQGKAGTAAWRTAVTHVYQNTGTTPIEGVLIEPKAPHSALPAGSVDETTLPTKHAKVEFENEQVRVVRYIIAPGQKIPMHGHTDNVQVALTDSHANVTADNKTTPVQIKAGEVRWRPATQHTVENTGDKPIEGILVEMKGGVTATAK